MAPVTSEVRTSAANAVIMVLAFAALVFSPLLWLALKGRLQRRLKVGPVDDSRAVSMPSKYLKQIPRRLSEVPIGETVHINFTAVAVNLNGSTFVELEAEVYEGPTIATVRVRRESSGCILTIPKSFGTPSTFRRHRLYPHIAYLPVLEVVEQIEQREG